MNDNAIQIKELEKIYGSGSNQVSALEKINLNIQNQEFICVLGPSGCGKTTLLNILAGFEFPTKGFAEVLGKPILGPGPDRTMMFQDYALFPWLTVRDNIAFGLSIKGIDSATIKKDVEHFAALVGLSSFIESYPHQLSGGMRQRVSIARALAVDPTVLLMDEPFAALDAQNRAMMQQEMIRILAEESKTVVLVTHSIEESINLSDVIIVMTRRPGRVKKVIHVPEPRRMIEDTPSYLAVRKQIRELISDEHDLSEVS